MTNTPTRDWLAEAIRNAWRKECPFCGNEGSQRLTCPEHAAEAVCEAVRQERLFIMPQADADGLYADAQQRAISVALDRVAPVALAQERQRMAHNGTGYVPPWDELTDHEREMSTIEAGHWLTALRRVTGVLAIATAQLAATLAKMRTLDLMPADVLHGDQRLSVPEVSEFLAEVGDSVAAVAYPDSRPQRRRRMTRKLLREVAEVYRQALVEGEAPTVAVREHFQVSHSTAARWVGQARKVGELGPAVGPTAGEAHTTKGEK